MCVFEKNFYDKKEQPTVGFERMDGEAISSW